MNLKKKIKGFFTLTRKANSGFTLVELIVVIAILAILAGVAVPAYNGYIKKADRSADEALLNEINTAFASACMANGESNIKRTDNPVINLTDKTINAEPLTTGNAGINESFKKFFEGEGKTFKTIDVLYYSGKLGAFAATEIPEAYAELLDKIKNDPNFASNKAAVLLSTFMTAEDLGAEGLMDQMGYLSGVSGTLLTAASMGEGSTFYDMIYTGSFLDDLAVKMGFEDSTELYSEYGSTKTPEEIDTMVSNGLILSVAEQTTKLTAEDKNFLNDTSTIKSYIQTGMSSGDTAEVHKAFTQASLAYGMYVSFANSEFGNADAIAKSNNVTDSSTLYAILDDMNSDAYKKYMESDQYQNDLKGYTAAMGMINSATGDKKAVKNIVENGYSDPALIALFQQAMG